MEYPESTENHFGIRESKQWRQDGEPAGGETMRGRRSRVLRSMGMIGAACLALAGCAWGTKPAVPPVTVVPGVDLARYMGKWYEIARYPNRFQKGCVDSTAEYALAPDGKSVEVVNRCTEEGPGGKARSVRGKARVVDPATNAKLSVTFFWPFSGDYWILALGPDYEYAVVGTPDRKYLWFLARTPAVPGDLYELLVREAARQGFDPARIMITSR
jgi:apolipoprotein D and lipocalin family protein